MTLLHFSICTQTYGQKIVYVIYAHLEVIRVHRNKLTPIPREMIDYREPNIV